MRISDWSSDVCSSDLRLGEVAPPGKEVVVDLQQVARRSHDEPPRLVGRIARRIGIGFVLVANLVARGSIAIAHGWTARKDSRPRPRAEIGNASVRARGWQYV